MWDLLSLVEIWVMEYKAAILNIYLSGPRSAFSTAHILKQKRIINGRFSQTFPTV